MVTGSPVGPPLGFGQSHGNCCPSVSLRPLTLSVCPPSFSFFNYMRTERDTHAQNVNCLQLLEGRVSSVPPAAGGAFLPELPAWTSRRPACLSWPTESYRIPANLSINSGVTKAAKGGRPSGLQRASLEPTQGKWVSPGESWEGGHQTGDAQSQARGAISRPSVEFIAAQRTGREIYMPEKEVSLS